MARWGDVLALAVAVIATAGCGDDDAVPLVDAGVDAAVDAGVSAIDAGRAVVVAPNISWWNAATGVVDPPGQPLACLSGWRLVEADGVRICDPWPAGGRSVCPDGSAHFPGRPGCEPLSPCPTGAFSDALPTTGVVLYVDAAAAAGGDGSRSAPYQRIGDAVAVAPALATIAVARGTYDTVVALRDGVTLFGACAASTIIAPTSATGSAAAVVLTNAGIRDVTIRSSAQGVTASPGSARIENVLIDAPSDVGIASNADLVLRRVVVRGAHRVSAAQSTGIAVAAGDADLREVMLLDNQDFGMLIHGAVLVHDVSVIGSVASSTGSSARGVSVQPGGSITGDYFLVEGSEQSGIEVAGDLRLADVTVRDTTPRRFSRALGMGMLVAGSAMVELTRVVLERNHRSGIEVTSSTATVHVTNAVIRDTLGEESTGDHGYALLLFAGSVTLEGGVLERSHDAAVLASGAGASVTLRDVLIRDTQPDSRGGFGRGLGIQLGATATLESTVIERSREIGMFVGGARASALLRDVVFRDTLGREVDGVSGRGLSVEVGASATLERVRIERSRDLGLIAQDTGTMISGENVSVRESLEQACADTTCGETPFGIGVGAYYGAMVQLTGFDVADATLCGVQVAAAGGLDLTNGSVTGAEIGACVQIDDYDFDRLTDGVTYTDNVRGLETTMLPIPAPNP